MNPQPYDYEADMLTILLKALTASQVASSIPILTEILDSSLSIWKTRDLTVIINKHHMYRDNQAKPSRHHCNNSYKVKLEEWGINPLPSDYEAVVLTIWLKAWTAGQVDTNLSILIGILHCHNGPYCDVISHYDVTWIALQCCFDHTWVAIGCILTLWF